MWTAKTFNIKMLNSDLEAAWEVAKVFATLSILFFVLWTVTVFTFLPGLTDTKTKVESHSQSTLEYPLAISGQTQNTIQPWPVLSTGAAFTQWTTVSPCVCSPAVCELKAATGRQCLNENHRPRQTGGYKIEELDIVHCSPEVAGKEETMLFFLPLTSKKEKLV